MIKVGIFFGGKSREREISFAGGRTVYDNLDKSLFEAIPLFVDSLGKITLLEWSYIYKGTIRDFFPGPAINTAKRPFQVYADSLLQLPESEYIEIQKAVGKPISLEELPGLMDFAFLTLHGPFGEDGNIQGILEWFQIPYSGSGIFPSAFGINKIRQRNMLQALGFEGPRHLVISRKEMERPENLPVIWEKVQQEIGLPCVLKAPHQGSSIGVSIVKTSEFHDFREGLLKSFFLQSLEKEDWSNKNQNQKWAWMSELLDVRTGVGLPVSVYIDGTKNISATYYQPEDLIRFLDERSWSHIVLEPLDAEEEILIESFIEGKEFSCIVIEDLQGNPLALPPTEIIKFSSLFDYRSKYLPGISRKITPIDIPESQLQEIKRSCEKMYTAFGFQVYARLDGFISPEGKVFLNDPNTTSGMLPSSFFFHQSAEIGLNPSQFLSYIISRSLHQRLKNGKNRAQTQELIQKLEDLMNRKEASETQKIRVGVIMGGYSTERHISMESGRNIFEKLASSEKYHPIPYFLTGNDSSWQIYRIPVKMMLKDNADDIKKLVENPQEMHPFILQTIHQAREITRKFASDAIFDAQGISLEELASQVDEVFIALHGRPGEDGSLQVHLDQLGIPYNGSGVDSSQKTINKFETNALLRKHGISVAGHRMVYKSDWLENEAQLLDEISAQFPFPIIAKPADDGCSSAVKKIKTREELAAFCELMFRESEEKPAEAANILHLKANEEFPMKNGFLVETLIEKGKAVHFLEITGGLRTIADAEGNRVYEVFQPSETLASGEVLSLEEKFLAGEGQNITPARFSPDAKEQERISNLVRKTLQTTAEILNVEGYCRIDAFVRIFADGQVETIIIEINSLPGMTPATCIFHQAAIADLRPLDFIDSILEYGKSRQTMAGLV